MKARSLLMVIPGVILIASAGISAAGGMDRPGATHQAKPAGETAEASSPIMVPNDYLEYLEAEKGLETGSLTSPDVPSTEIPGPSEMVEIPEGG